MDVRTGGKYRLNFGDGMDFFGRYIEVTPPSRIVWTNEEGGENGSVTTVTFEEKGGQTLLVLSDVYPSKEALDAAGTGAVDAMEETFVQLDELLATLPGGTLGLPEFAPGTPGTTGFALPGSLLSARTISAPPGSWLRRLPGGVRAALPSPSARMCAPPALRRGASLGARARRPCFGHLR